MSNILQFKPRFSLGNFTTYSPLDVEEGLSVILDSQYQPKNGELIGLRLDREMRGDFMKWVSERDSRLLGDKQS